MEGFQRRKLSSQRGLLAISRAEAVSGDQCWPLLPESSRAVELVPGTQASTLPTDLMLSLHILCIIMVF